MRTSHRKAVLFVDGALWLRVFEPRHFDMFVPAISRAAHAMTVPAQTNFIELKPRHRFMLRVMAICTVPAPRSPRTPARCVLRLYFERNPSRSSNQALRHASLAALDSVRVANASTDIHLKIDQDCTSITSQTPRFARNARTAPTSKQSTQQPPARTDCWHCCHEKQQEQKYAEAADGWPDASSFRFRAATTCIARTQFESRMTRRRWSDHYCSPCSPCGWAIQQPRHRFLVASDSDDTTTLSRRQRECKQHCRR